MDTQYNTTTIVNNITSKQLSTLGLQFNRATIDDIDANNLKYSPFVSCVVLRRTHLVEVLYHFRRFSLLDEHEIYPIFNIL